LFDVIKSHTIIPEEDNEESGGEEVEEEEEDVKKIDEKLEMMRTKLKEKTMKINTMTQALNGTMQRSGVDFTADDGGDDFDRERIPEEEEEDNAYYDDDPQGGNGGMDDDNDEDYNENDGEVVVSSHADNH
jgi:hypothetical protein